MMISKVIRKLSLREREALAEQVGTTAPYLSRIAYGNGKTLPGPQLSKKLAKALQMPLADVRPDLWGDA